MLRNSLLNLGIVAHVDAGKTTLTERLLHAAGVIDEVGSVDKGTTQTDTLALEQRRGITIKAAVVSFAIDDVAVNLIDTPGHPDFIAEVERVLGVLDGAVLVVSGVEGVQPQTRILMRALKRLRIPTLIFVNKLDRPGADFDRTIADIRARLTSAVVPADADDAMLAEVLAENDDDVLAAYLDDRISHDGLREELAAQAKRALVHPAFGGAAIKGEGVAELMRGIATLLPVSTGDPDAPLSATVFKIERDATGRKVAYVRLFAGTLRTRDRVDRETKITALDPPVVRAGDIARVWGLGHARIGDTLGEPSPRRVGSEFPPPTLESVVDPVDADDTQRLRVALEQLAEQDPLIGVRQDDARRELSVSLYGEVQKEVIQATLADDYGIDVTFRETTPIYVERPIAVGNAVEELHAETNPYNASIGLRVEPAPEDTGITFCLDVETRDIPLYVYKTRESFTEHMDEYVRTTLSTGLFGWQVTDCRVTMTHCIYSLADGPPSRRGPTSTAADFRNLTPLVLRRAVERAGTAVCEPIVRVRLEVPTASIGAVMAALGRLGGSLETPSAGGALAVVETTMSTTRADELHRELAGLTGGEGVLESTFAGYQAVAGDPPTRR